VSSHLRGITLATETVCLALEPLGDAARLRVLNYAIPRLDVDMPPLAGRRNAL
jgi:hypothetical protein